MAAAISQRKLDDLRREWQKLLRLQDWKISAKFATNGETCGDLGECSFIAEAKTAKIMILASDEVIDDEHHRKQDVENTLVHELLHCHFAPFFSGNKAVMLQQEQAIESIAGALVGLKRRKNAAS